MDNHEPGNSVQHLDRILRSRAALLAPPLVLAACLLLWAAEVLNWDEWLIWADVLEKLQGGTFGPLDLIVQNNEQRSAIVRLLGLAFFPLFRLDRAPELAMIFLMAAGCVFLAARLYRQSFPETQDRRALAVFSLLGFSLVQWETFSVGINTSVVLPVLGLWAGVCLAWGKERLSWARLAGLALLGLLPSFSFANALFSWPCLAPLVALRAGSRRRAWTMTVLWLAFGALVWVAYFTGYAKPGHHPPLFATLLSPVSLGTYFVAYLGGALAVDRNLLPLALLAGAFALFALAVLVRAAWKGGDEARASLWPWLCVAAFTLLTASATAVGRSGFGPAQALASRYATFSSPLWMVLAVLFLQHGQRLAEPLRRWLGRGFLGCLALFLVSSLLAAIVLHNRKPRLERARQELYRLTKPEDLLAVFPDPAFVIAKAPLFLRLRAGIYRELLPLGEYRQGRPLEGWFAARPRDAMAGRVHGFFVQGAALGQDGRPVLFCAAGRIVGMGRVAESGGFELFLPENALPAGPQLLQASVLDSDGLTLRALNPVAGAGLVNQGRETTEFELERHFFVPWMRQAGSAPGAGGS